MCARVLLLLFLVSTSWLQRTASWGQDQQHHLSEDEGDVKWGYVKEMIDNISATARQRTMAYTAELGLMLDRANATMQAFHARSLANFRELTANSTTVNAEYFQKQWRSLNRPSLLPQKERFTVLHHTDSLGLHRLYRVMRAQEQLEALGHAYAVLYRRPRTVINGSTDDAHLDTLRALLPGLDVFVSTDGRDDAVALARSWFRASNSTRAAADSGVYWVLGLDVEWVGSLPHVLTSLGRDRARRGPLAVLSVGCVDADKEKVAPASVAAKAATAAAGAVSDVSPGLGMSSRMRQQLRLCRQSLRNLVSRAVSTSRLTLHWLVARLWGRVNEAPKRSCGEGVLAVSRAVLAGDLGEGSSSVTGLFNAALASEGTRAATRDGTRYGVINSLLHADFLHGGECQDCGCSEAGGSNDTLTRSFFSSIKEGYLKQVLPFSPGLLFRCGDKCDYDNDV